MGEEESISPGWDERGEEGLGQCPPENTGSIYRFPSVALSPIALLEESNVLIWERERELRS